MLTDTDWLILVLSFFMLWGSHHFPWKVMGYLVDRQGELKKVPAYVVGITCILASMAAWSYFHGTWEAFAFLVLVCVAAGLGTIAPRLAKREAEFQALREDVEDYDASARQ